MSEITRFCLLGLLGGIISVVVHAKNSKDFKRFPTLRVIVLGALMGIVYHFMRSEWNYPNSVMAIVAGYAGSDLIDSLIKKVRP